MSKDRLDRRDHLKLQKEAEELLAWRVKNSERLRWEMFLRNFGPEGDFDHLGETPRNEEEEAAFAHREMLQRILKHYTGDAPCGHIKRMPRSDPYTVDPAFVLSFGIFNTIPCLPSNGMNVLDSDCCTADGPFFRTIASCKMITGIRGNMSQTNWFLAI